MIAIVDYGMGNLRSVQKALERCGGDARIVHRPQDIADAQKILLPGVGAFADAIARLHELELVDPLRQAAASGKPFLGICLGMQLLFETSFEDGQHIGLEILPGEVVRFDFSRLSHHDHLAIPHMGWNQLTWDRPCPLLNGLASGGYAYFAHSYHCVPVDPDVTLCRTQYGYEFTSAVWRDNVMGTQFHPEKSQSFGLTMLRNFVTM